MQEMGDVSVEGDIDVDIRDARAQRRITAKSRGARTPETQ